jgi:putative transposase
MGRPSRQFVAGYPVHVVHRGNDRHDIFRRDADYRILSRWLKDTADQYDVAVNAYVFMTNHLHLLLTPTFESTSISKMIQVLARNYAAYFNTRYERTGTLWEGRFKASLVTRDSYLLACHRYIDMNPVRAGIVSRPGDYPWSSHRFYAYREENPLVTPHRALSCLADDPEDRSERYLALFERPMEQRELDAIRESVNSGRPVGQPPRRGQGMGQSVRHDPAASGV